VNRDYYYKWTDWSSRLYGRRQVRSAFTSMNRVFTPVNAYQAEGFAQYGREMRDPMFLTMMIALELETFPSFRSLKRHTDSLDPYVLRMLVLSSCMSCTCPFTRVP
jgi:hypothetical protein